MAKFEGHMSGQPGGFLFNLSDPDVHRNGKHQLCLRDMCHALGRTTRFAGNSQSNTAWHSLEVAKLARELAIKDGMNLLEQTTVYRQGLIHDIHEAITGDITRPMKCACPQIAEVERKVAAVIREELGFPAELHRLVTLADTTVGTWEWEYLVRDRIANSFSDDDGQRLYQEISQCGVEFTNV